MNHFKTVKHWKAVNTEAEYLSSLGLSTNVYEIYAAIRKYELVVSTRMICLFDSKFNLVISYLPPENSFRKKEKGKKKFLKCI